MRNSAHDGVDSWKQSQALNMRRWLYDLVTQREGVKPATGLSKRIAGTGIPFQGIT